MVDQILRKKGNRKVEVNIVWDGSQIKYIERVTYIDSEKVREHFDRSQPEQFKSVLEEEYTNLESMLYLYNKLGNELKKLS